MRGVRPDDYGPGKRRCLHRSLVRGGRAKKMKISKVNHVRTAVGVHHRGQTNGFLYQDPNRMQKTLSVEQQFEKLNRTAGRLYSVIGPLKPDEQKDNNKSQIHRIFQQINAEYRRSGFSPAVLRRTQISEDNAAKYDMDKVDPADFLLQKLKRTLRGSEMQEYWIRLFRFVFRQDSALDIDEKSLQKFSEILKNDYLHEKTRVNVEKAILHQNMNVQPDRKGVIRLPDKRKDAGIGSIRERNALNAFLLQYANCNKSVRERYLRELRRLIQIYFYGVEAVNPEDFDVWKDHESHRTEHTLFLTNFTTQHQDADGKFVESTGESDCHALKEQWERLQSLREKSKQDIQKKQEAEKALKKAIQDADHQVKYLMTRIKDEARYQNIRAYRESLRYTQEHPELFFQDPDWNKCFIHLIENHCNLLFRDFSPKEFFRLHRGYLSEKCWKYLINYLCIKYTAIGKVVYHYACMEFGKSGDITLGTFKKDISAINSFEYEMIQAEEELQRDTTVYISFAIQNFAQNAFRDEYRMGEGQEDVLLYHKKDIQEAKRPDALRRVLQFFGGKSKWLRVLPKDLKEEEFLMDLVNMFYQLRNKTFHFSTGNTDNSKWDEGRILSMMEKEGEECNVIRRKTWYSNNLWMFFSQKSLGDLMSLLYKEDPVRGVQVPSFKNVLGRKAFSEYLRDTEITPLRTEPVEIQEMWHNGYYYILKEIYYQKFLAEPSLKKDFYDSLNKELRNLEEDTTKEGQAQYQAMREFLRQWKQLDQSLSFPEICQYYMTEYNAQNQNIRVVQSTRMQKNNPKNYQHYKMILYRGIRTVFQNYIITNKAYAFLRHPIYRNEKIDVENFLPEWKENTFQEILNKARKDRELQCWYICSRFLAPRQVNHLDGVFRHYLEYISAVERRASENGQNLSLSPDLTEMACKDRISLLEFTRVLSGNISADFKDYFEAEDGKTAVETYSDYISKYADINGINQETQALIDDPANLYLDPAHPILNRNVVLAMLYAPENILENAVAKISYPEYEEYIKLKEQYPKNLITGGSTKLSEQKLVNAFRDSKNRVELFNLYEYAEIINELQAHLVSWSFLRERDLLYFQLGFHYLCLQNDSPKPAGYETLTSSDGRIIHGAVLYHTLAIFVYGYPMYCVNDKLSDKEKKEFESSASKPTSAKALLFDKNYRGCFDAGKELFQTMKEERNVLKLRDYIDHFKYYAKADRSILDLYSEVFDRFFTNDQRLRKNVPNVFANILARYFIQIKGLRFETGTKTVGRGEKKDMALICFDRLTSDTFTYKLINDEKKGNGKGKEETGGCNNLDEPVKVELPARGKQFLRDVERILRYCKVG